MKATARMIRLPVYRAALCAGLLSCLIHVSGFYWLDQMPLSWAQVTVVEPDVRWRISIAMERVSRQDPTVPDTAGSDGSSADASGAIRPDVTDPRILPVPAGRLTPPTPAGTILESLTTVAVTPDEWVPFQDVFEPRQEILAVDQAQVRNELAGLERRRIPRMERVEQAPDVTVPVDRTRLVLPDPRHVSEAFPQLPINRDPVAADPQPVPAASIEPVVQPGSGRLLDPLPGRSTIKALEDFLTADLETYSSWTERKYGYFRLVLRRAGETILPVLPKDVVLIQDCSASMAEERLHFCREGLKQILNHLGAQDRFTVVSFKDQSVFCFPSWVSVNVENRARAVTFIDALRSGGNTDLYASIRSLFQLERHAGRPVVVLLLTDGRPTTGMVGSAEIIAEFSKQNAGQMALFTMGTIQTANAYLLDLLAYCNRGESRIVRSGRWGIPGEMELMAKETSRPVLMDVRFQFAGVLRESVFPELTTHLYLDRDLVLYGRYPRGTDRVVFRAVGRSGDTPCDMVFDLNLTGGKSSRDAGIRTRWAEQCLNDLIARYTRGGSPSVLEAIRGVSRDYKIKVPYGNQF